MMESYPEQCRTPDGRTFVRDIGAGASSSSASSAASSAHPVSLQAMMEQRFNGGELALGEVLARTEAYTRYTITYRSGDLTVSGIMNIPTGDGPFPLLVLNHGHIDTSVYTNGRGLKREQDFLARRGYAVIHPDYRNHAFSDTDEENELRFRLGYVEDAINAILAVRSADMPQIDAERVGMLGHSMGGGVTLSALVVRPDLIDAAVLFAPVSADARRNFERWQSRNSSLASAIAERYGLPDDAPAFWDGISPQTYVDRIAAPVLIHHGTEDADVPLQWSVALDALLREAENDVTFHVYEGEPHEFIGAWGVVMRRTGEFFDALLKEGAGEM